MGSASGAARGVLKRRSTHGGSVRGLLPPVPEAGEAESPLRRACPRRSLCRVLPQSMSSRKGVCVVGSEQGEGRGAYPAWG
eukprot:13285422-Alexandrium_andersonii.AAC.1